MRTSGANALKSCSVRFSFSGWGRFRNGRRGRGVATTSDVGIGFVSTRLWPGITAGAGAAVHLRPDFGQLKPSRRHGGQRHRATLSDDRWVGLFNILDFLATALAGHLRCAWCILRPCPRGTGQCRVDLTGKILVRAPETRRSSGEIAPLQVIFPPLSERCCGFFRSAVVSHAGSGGLSSGTEPSGPQSGFPLYAAGCA